MKRKDFSKIKVDVQKNKTIYFEHENYIAGIEPHLRGIYSTMYFHHPLKTTTTNNIASNKNINPSIEVANFLTSSFKYLQKNTPIDNAVSTISFQTFIGENHFIEIAKIRAIRMLWSKMIKSFNPKNHNSYTLTINATINNSIDAFAAIFAGCQSIASNNKTHLFFEVETGILKTIDPWAGSNYLEILTEEITNEAWAIFLKETNF